MVTRNPEEKTGEPLPPPLKIGATIYKVVRVNKCKECGAVTRSVERSNIKAEYGLYDGLSYFCYVCREWTKHKIVVYDSQIRDPPAWSL